jgi:prevent-host-death family protein
MRVGSARRRVDVRDAKARLSSLLADVERGREVVIVRAGRPIARLVPIARQLKKPIFGADRRRFAVPADFDAPLPGKVLASFEPFS